MTELINEKKLIEIFISCDDFDKMYEKWLKTHTIGLKVTTRKPDLSDSEIMTILIFYHWSGYKNFQYYYEQLVEKTLVEYFPKIPTYHRFVELISRQTIKLYVYLKVLTFLSKRTGNYFIDSKKLPVCDNRRIHSNKVFEGFAKRGKSSTGWFYGLKIHLIINELGQIVNFMLTPASVADNNESLLKKMLKGLKGKCFGDKGYISKLFSYFYEQGLQLVHKIRGNMKNQLMYLNDKINLKKRALIESVNDILMTVFDIEHTRHRSPINAIAHTFGALIAYCFYDEKPTVFIYK